MRTGALHMSYVVYNVQSTQTVNEKRWGRETYKTEAAAKAARTRLIKKGYSEDQLAVSEIAFYSSKIVKTVTRINMMTGLPYEESVNTPLCCSPASETYWSM
jgi:hypothetical protein